MLTGEKVSRRQAILVVTGPLSGDPVDRLDGKMGELRERFTTVTLDLAQVPSPVRNRHRLDPRCPAP
jgi:hypothetical protein